jgi:hypothetical protein
VSLDLSTNAAALLSRRRTCSIVEDDIAVRMTTVNL